jgi:hypothetical protein
VIPQSTLAMSIVSLLGKIGTSPRATAVEVVVAHFALHRVVQADIEQAVDAAIERGLVVAEAGGVRSALPAGYVVLSRNRSGDGWGGWIAMRPDGSKIPVAELIQGGA